MATFYSVASAVQHACNPALAELKYDRFLLGYVTILIFLRLLKKESVFIFLGQVLEKFTYLSCKTEFVKLKIPDPPAQ